MMTTDIADARLPLQGLQLEQALLSQDPEHWRLAGLVFFNAFSAACALLAAADGVAVADERRSVKEVLRGTARAFPHFDEDDVVETFDAYLADVLAGGERRRRVALRVARIACDQGAVDALARLCRSLARCDGHLCIKERAEVAELTWLLGAEPFPLHIVGESEAENDTIIPAVLPPTGR